MSRIMRHPSERKVRKWSTSGQGRAISEHVAGCEECTELLERIQPSADEVTNALLGAMAPPADLESRMTAAVSDKVRDRESLEVFADLFGLGWLTSRAIIGEPSKGDEIE